MFWNTAKVSDEQFVNEIKQSFEPKYFMRISSMILQTSRLKCICGILNKRMTANENNELKQHEWKGYRFQAWTLKKLDVMDLCGNVQQKQFESEINKKK